MNLKWILGKALEQREKWLGKKLRQTKGAGERGRERGDEKERLLLEEMQ